MTKNRRTYHPVQKIWISLSRKTGSFTFFLNVYLVAVCSCRTVNRVLWEIEVLRLDESPKAVNGQPIATTSLVVHKTCIADIKIADVEQRSSRIHWKKGSQSRKISRARDRFHCSWHLSREYVLNSVPLRLFSCVELFEGHSCVSVYWSMTQTIHQHFILNFLRNQRKQPDTNILYRGLIILERQYTPKYSFDIWLAIAEVEGVGRPIRMIGSLGIALSPKQAFGAVVNFREIDSMTTRWNVIRLVNYQKEVATVGRWCDAQNLLNTVVTPPINIVWYLLKKNGLC